jgi:arylsulfatase A-like enzyme
MFIRSIRNTQRTGRRPNIVFFLADDLGYGDISCFGQRRFSTPNIDKLAETGMRFSRHYSGSPVCAPSRCVLMTGLHSGHAPIRDNKDVGADEQMPVPTNIPLLSEFLSDLGYICGGFGKWGLGKPGNSGEPLRRGFNRFFGYHGQRHAHNHYPAFLDDGSRKVALNNPDFSPNQKLKPTDNPADSKSYDGFIGNEYAPERITREACYWIESHKNEPFFCYIPTTIPHLALQAPPDATKAELGKHGTDTPYTGAKSYLPNLNPRATYAAMIRELDKHVGQVIDTIKRLGLEDDTIFVFTSDNGPLYDQLGGTDTDYFDSASGLRGRKGSLYEGGIRIPAIVSWKGHITAGQSTDTLSGFEDWVPTLLDLLDASETIPKNTDGVSHATELLGKPTKHRKRFLYREFAGYGGWQGVWHDRFKAVRSNLDKGQQPWELYNLRDDPRELTNIATKSRLVVSDFNDYANRQHKPSKDFPLKGLGDKAQ